MGLLADEAALAGAGVPAGGSRRLQWHEPRGLEARSQVCGAVGAPLEGSELRNGTIGLATGLFWSHIEKTKRVRAAPPCYTTSFPLISLKCKSRR